MKYTRIGIALLTLLLFTVCAYAQNNNPQVSAAPDWIKSNTYDYTQKQLDIEAEYGYIDFILEKQISLSHRAIYYRKAIKILTQEGVQNSSEVSVSFDPTFERLSFHGIRVIRGKETIDQLKLSKIKTIHQEKELSRFIYNGSLTSVLILDDIRKGDVIEYSYTLTGFNPIFGDRYTDDYSLNYGVPAYNIYYKLLVPDGRRLNFKNSNTEIKPLIKKQLLEISYEWKANNIKALRLQDGVPGWYDPYSTIFVSEYNSWKEVNDWAMPLYAPVKRLSRTLQNKIDEFRKLDSPEKQILAVLKFVQDDIRYMGIEIGENSHKPNPPDKIFSQRFGDCKDKSYLLCSMLQSLGIEANPVFINTSFKKTIKTWLPSPRVFDHVTVRVRFNDKYYWFDPTISFQRGSMKDISYPDYQCGLVISGNTSALSDIVVQDAGKVVVNETFNIYDYVGKVKLMVTTDYSGSFADDVRQDFDANSLYEIQKKYKEYYGRYYKGTISDSITYVDQEATGVFSITEYYTISDLWKLEKGKREALFDPYVIDGVIRKPKESARTMPFSLAFPALYEEHILINLPSEWRDVEEVKENLKNSGFNMKADFTYYNNKIALNYAYENLKDHVSADESKEFLDDIEKKENTLSYILKSGAINSQEKSKSSSNDLLSNIIGGIVLIAAIIIIAIKTKNR